MISSLTVESFWDIIEAGTEEATLTSLPLRFVTLGFAVEVDIAAGICLISLGVFFVAFFDIERLIGRLAGAKGGLRGS